jgi:hypothetical protein
LVHLIDLWHELVKLADLIDWEAHYREFFGGLLIDDWAAVDTAAIGDGLAVTGAHLTALRQGSRTPLG